MKILFVIALILGWFFCGLLGIGTAIEGERTGTRKINVWFLVFFFGIFFLEPLILWCIG